jgi:uncharacterized membrane protein
MNAAHFHLIVNHLPIIFPLVGAIVLATGLVIKSEAVKRTAFMIFVFGSIASIFAMLSGEGAEEVVEKLNGVTENYISTHEETAEKFALLSYALGAVSLLGIWASIKKKTFSSIISIATLVFTIVVLFFAKQTGTTGGEIRHTEIRSGATVSTNEDKKAEQEDEK